MVQFTFTIYYYNLYLRFLSYDANPSFQAKGEIFLMHRNPLLWSYNHAWKLIYLLLFVQKLSFKVGVGGSIMDSLDTHYKLDNTFT